MKREYLYIGGIAFLIFYLYKCKQANKELAAECGLVWEDPIITFSETINKN